MPGSRKGYTTPHRNIPCQRDSLVRHRLQEKISDTHIQFHSPIYLGLGFEAKSDIYHKFTHDKPISIELDPPSTDKPPLLQVKQEGKQPIFTTDFYFTNIKLSDSIIPAPDANKDSSLNQAAASDPPAFHMDPTQQGEVRLHSWHLYTSQVTGSHTYCSHRL